MSQVNSKLQKVPKGYKQTEIGVIPDDWDVSEFGNLVNYTKGYPFKSADYTSDGTRIIRVSDTTFNSIEDVGAVYIAEIESSKYKKWRLRTNDLIFTTVGSKPPMYDSLVGKAILVTERHSGGLLNQNAVIIRAKNSAIFFQKLMLNHFRTDRYINYIEIIYRGNANQASITLKNLFQFKLPIPKDIEEQAAVATALSDVDALITSLEKLIGKKRDIKTAAMQQLLTGKKRLPPFDSLNTQSGTPRYKKTELGKIPDDWDAGFFGDYLDSCSSGATPYRGRPEFYRGNVRWVTSGELNYNVIYDTVEKISLDAVKRTNLKLHPAGTFLMAITGLEAAGTRGSCGIVGAPSTTNQSCMALYPNKRLSNKFLFYYYVYKGNELAFKYCQGTKQQSYTAKIVKLLPINAPKTIEEQNLIASVLSDVDKEIATLEQRLNKTQQIKQGMMQELLTGRTRLV